MNVIPAKWTGPKRDLKTIKLVVVHSMEAPDKPDTAEAVGRFFQNLPFNRKASAHQGADSNSVVRYVDDDVVAYAAPGANANGVHMELTGYASWLAGQWTTPTMATMLAWAADSVRDWCDRYGIPKRFVDAAGLLRGERGITTHYEVSQAFRQSDHTDPGKGFPIHDLIARVNNSPSTSTPGVTMAAAIGAAIEPVCSTTLSGGGGYIVGRRGHVYSFDGALYYGGWAEADPGPTDRSGRDCVAIVPTKTERGYWLVSDSGEVYAYGDAPWPGNYDHDKWGGAFGQIVGAFRNDLIEGTGGLTMVRDDGKNLMLYRLPG